MKQVETQVGLLDIKQGCGSKLGDAAVAKPLKQTRTEQKARTTS